MFKYILALMLVLGTSVFAQEGGEGEVPEVPSSSSTLTLSVDEPEVPESTSTVVAEAPRDEFTVVEEVCVGEHPLYEGHTLLRLTFVDDWEEKDDVKICDSSVCYLYSISKIKEHFDSTGDRLYPSGSAGALYKLSDGSIVIDGLVWQGEVDCDEVRPYNDLFLEFRKYHAHE